MSVLERDRVGFGDRGKLEEGEGGEKRDHASARCGCMEWALMTAVMDLQSI